MNSDSSSTVMPSIASSSWSCETLVAISLCTPSVLGFCVVGIGCRLRVGSGVVCGFGRHLGGSFCLRGYLRLRGCFCLRFRGGSLGCGSRSLRDRGRSLRHG